MPLLEGDGESEDVLTDIGFPTYLRACAARWSRRRSNMGRAVGTWRLLRIFERFDIKVSVPGCGARAPAMP